MPYVKDKSLRSTPYKGISLTYVVSRSTDKKRIYYYQAYKKIGNRDYKRKKFFPNAYGNKNIALDAAILWVDNAENYITRFNN